MKPLLFAAALSALAMPVHADDWVRHGTVPGTSIIWDMNSEGTYVFSNGAYGSGHLEGALVEKGGGMMGRSNLTPGTNHATFYRPDLNIMIDLETGMICWGVGTAHADCK